MVFVSTLRVCWGFRTTLVRQGGYVLVFGNEAVSGKIGKNLRENKMNKGCLAILILAFTLTSLNTFGQSNRQMVMDDGFYFF